MGIYRSGDTRKRYRVPVGPQEAENARMKSDYRMRLPLYISRKTIPLLFDCYCSPRGLSCPEYREGTRSTLRNTPSCLTVAMT